MIDDVADVEHRLGMRTYELEMLIHKCLYNLAESLGLLADVLADISMDARTRIEIAQEAQDRVGVVLDALGITAGRPGANQDLDEIRWIDDGGAVLPEEGG